MVKTQQKKITKIFLVIVGSDMARFGGVTLQVTLIPRFHKCMIRRIYFQLLRDLEIVSWKCMMFQNIARPKLFSFCGQTRDYLLLADSSNKACMQWKCNDEDREHLFSKCFYAQQLWNKLLLWIQNHLLLHNHVCITLNGYSNMEKGYLNKLEYSHLYMLSNTVSLERRKHEHL